MTGIAIKETQLDFSETRRAQRRWALRSPRERCRIIRKARLSLAEEANALAVGLSEIRGIEETEALVTEVLPLLDAMKFVERRARWILRSRRLGRWGSPLWLMSKRSRVERAPFGVVLVIGPSNYPLFLTGVQLIQALVAGNAVCLKPAPGAIEPLQRLRQTLLASGAPSSLVLMLGDTNEDAASALASGPDLVSFTGSSNVGRNIQSTLSRSSIPSLMELSGCDAMVVDASADVDLAARAWVYGICLNRGRTCIAPRRIIIHRSVRDPFLKTARKLLLESPESLKEYEFDSNLRRRIATATERDSASVVLGELGPDGTCQGPVVIEGVDWGDSWATEDWFAPVSTMDVFDMPHEAVELANISSFGLGASIFCTDTLRAGVYASDLQVGVVTINDLIAPLADPRLPFGGCRASGYGVTRGAEGLLAMTRPKVSVLGSRIARARFLRDLSPSKEIFYQLVRLNHGDSMRGRLRAAWRMARGILKQSKRK